LVSIRLGGVDHAPALAIEGDPVVSLLCILDEVVAQAFEFRSFFEDPLAIDAIDSIAQVFGWGRDTVVAGHRQRRVRRHAA